MCNTKNRRISKQRDETRSNWHQMITTGDQQKKAEPQHASAICEAVVQKKCDAIHEDVHTTSRDHSHQTSLLSSFPDLMNVQRNWFDVCSAALQMKLKEEEDKMKCHNQPDGGPTSHVRLGRMTVYHQFVDIYYLSADIMREKRVYERPSQADYIMNAEAAEKKFTDNH